MNMLGENEENNLELGKNQNFDKNTHKKEKYIKLWFLNKRQNHVASFVLERLVCGLQELLNLWSCPSFHLSKNNQIKKKHEYVKREKRKQPRVG